MTTTTPTDEIWHTHPDLALAGSLSEDCVVGLLGIEFTDAGADWLTARMPVDRRTRQPLGLLHGGSSVLLAETLVSFAASFVVEPGRACVGTEISAHHLRSVRSGWVTGTARPVSIGRRTQVWDTRIEDDEGRLVCVSRCTVAVVEAR
ncbi:hotdog fold thioesterase [Nocardioides anomalus]|uniref:Hotdog fold thioesterase n=1 Tax=Nocardioides anomalus TaxID=2712223 RepID=A0A6G6WFC2_9ACTN|nr:hotdog fold thioesterase [Nocardioides anomalus]QIG43909.1 hotdog fold thioesterase [Nocardioides anomalus]